MSRFTRVRLARAAFAAILLSPGFVAPALAAPVPSPAVFTAAAQDQPASALTGFGKLPVDATLISSASGVLDPALEAPASLQIERIELAPGDELPSVDTPQILQVEQGTLTFEDDLGLEAELDAGSAQFFAAGEVGAITNSGEEQALIVRTSISGSAAAPATPTTEDATPTPEDSGNGGGEIGERPGASQPSGSDGGNEAAGIAALYAQSTPTPSEVVITLDDNGFDPDSFEILQGGELVIENATEDACVFAIPDLQIETTIDAGDIESIVVDGPAGIHEFTCTPEGADQPSADGSFFLTRPQTTSDEASTPEPAASPEPGDAVATPQAEESPTPSATAAAENGSVGILLDATLETMPGGDQQLFAAQIVLNAGASLSVSESNEAIGIVVTGGDLTVSRENRAPSKLRDGRSVLLPGGTAADLTNEGQDPITLQVAGVSGTEAASSGSTADEPTETATQESVDNGPVDTTGANQFLPTDAEMENLGLVVQPSQPVEVTDPSDNAIWFDDAGQATELLPTFDWQSALQSAYDSQGDVTDYGEVQFLVINIDVHGGDQGAADFYSYIEQDIFGNQADSSDTVAALDGVTQQMYATIYDSEQQVDIGFMVIQSGSYVLTLYAVGPDLDATSLMEDTATLIFGPRG